MNIYYKALHAFYNNIFVIKVRCVVRAHPPANVDWVKQGETVETGGGDDGDDGDDNGVHDEW